MIKTINLRKLIPCILLPILVGLVGSFFTRNSTEVYANLNRPPFSPPGIIFPFVWTFLYVLMGISSYFICESDCKNKKRLTQIYLIGLGLNLLWPILFFALEWFAVAMIEIIALFAVIAVNTFGFYNCYKTSGYLFLPYLLWLVFAVYLNIGVVALN